jgi:hypothetical protein
MGVIARHSGAPFSDGDILDGTDDLEADINAIVTEVNGSLDNANIASGAAIDGSKLANTSISGDKLSLNTITVSKMAASAVPKHHVDTVSSYGNLETSNATLVDWTGLSSASLTPGNSGDVILMDLTFHYDAAADDASNPIVVGWSVDGVDYDSVIESTPVAANNETVVSSTYAVTTPSSGSAITIKPRQRYNGTQTIAVGFVFFQCTILPGK